METLASVSGALDTTTEVNISLAKEMNIIAQTALPILQSCETSNVQEKAMDSCFDLIGRLNLSQTNGGTTIADVAFDVNEVEANIMVQSMDSSKTSSTKILASALVATERKATNVKNVKSLCAAGAIEQLTKVASSSTDEKSRAAAQSSLAQMTKIALEDFEEAGNELIVDIMNANAESNQEVSLANCVNVLAKTDKGSEALAGLVSKSSGNKNAKVQAIVALSKRKQEGKTVSVNVASKSDVRAFMSAASEAPGSKGVVVMSCIPIASVATARQMADGGAIEMLQKSLMAAKPINSTTTATDDPSGAADIDRAAGGKAALATLQNIINSSKNKVKQDGQTDADVFADNKFISNKLRDLKIAASIAAALKGSDDPDFSNDCISLLQELTSMAGSEEDGMGLDEESLNLIMCSSATSGADQNSIDNLMHAMALNNPLAKSMISVGGAVDDTQIDSQMTETLTSLQTLSEVNNITAVLDPSSGKHYYVNRTTNETSWEKPAELLTLERNIDRLVDMCEVRGKDCKDMDTQLETMIKSVELHQDKQEVVTKLITVMNSLALNANNCNKIVESGGVATALRALHHAISTLPNLNKDGATNPKASAVIVQCLKLLSRFAVNDRFKRALSDANGVELVNHAVKSCLDVELISQHGVSCLGNMAFNFPVGVEKLVKNDGIKTLEGVLQKWLSSSTVIEVTLVTMSNIMFRNDPVKEQLGLTCGDEVVASLKTLIADTKVVIAAMRAMGNLASFENNVNWMLDNGAVENITNAMGHPSNKDNIELVQTAIDVIGNLASAGPDESDEEDDETKESVVTNIHRKIMYQGAVRGIVAAMTGSCKDNSAVSSFFFIFYSANFHKS